MLIGLLVALFGAVFQASAPGEADEILAQLSKIRLDKKQIYNIRDITIRRDALSISFNRGTLAFLEPVFGKVTGAVFIGDGEVVAIPPDSIEKQQIYRFTGSPILNESFRAGFFRFTDNTYEEILKEHAQHAEEDVSEDESAQFLPWEQVLSDRSSVLNYRILADYFGPAGRSLFLGELNGEKHGWFDVVYDPRLVEEVAVLKLNETANIVTPGIWASFNRRGETRDFEAASRENKSAVDVLSYDIDATISADNQLDARATIRMKALVEGERVLSFDLPETLRVSAVSLDPDQPVPIYGSAIVVLPRGLRAGEEIKLRFAYSGRADDRDMWYPGQGPLDRAMFNLTFHYPSTFNLVATGERLKEWEEDGQRHSTWKSAGELPTARFRAGNFTPAVNDSEVDIALNYFSNLFGRLPHKPLYVSRPGAGIIEIVREWFGNKVGARTYHDQWIFDGFARYAAAMYVDNKQPGMPKLSDDSEGPIWLGQRLRNNDLVTGKGMWVVHMIRMLMRSEAPDPDEAFFKMTREFLDSSRDALASTWDFKRIAEKYMTRTMDIRGDQKLDWFFDEWVLGTGIPSYKLDYQIDAAKDGFVVSGVIKQSGVPDHFVMPMPVYADDELLGLVVVDDEGTFQFVVKKRPEKILLDPHATILAKP